MYRLIIQNRDTGIWHDVDLDNDYPAMVYQVNDIAELKDRNADGSQAVRLPLTDNNINIFKHFTSPDSTSDAPYLKHPCRLMYNGYTLAGRDSYFIIDSVNEAINGQVLAGNANLFDYLKDNTMESLDLGYVELSPIGLNGVADTYIFPLASFRVDGLSASNSITPPLNPEYLYPSVYLKYIINSMINNAGFTLVHNLSDGDFNNKLISLATLKPNENSMNVFKGFNHSSSYPIPGGSYLPWTDDPLNNAKGLIRPFTLDGAAITGIEYESPIDGSVTVKIETEGLGGSIGSLIKFGESNPVYSWNDDGGGTRGGSFTIDVAKGDLIRFTIFSKATTPTDLSIYKFTIESFETDVVPFGGKVPISKNLGFNTQLDLFKAFAQLFGLIISVDNLTKTVYAYTFEKLYENKPIAKDWSTKLHMTNDNEDSFALGDYAQLNTISYNTFNGYTDTGSFTVNNESLARSKDLFKIEFESGNDYIQFFNGDTQGDSYYTANIPLLEYTYERDPETGSIISTTITFKGGKPHILNREEENFSTPVQIGIGEPTLINMYPVRHVKVQSIIDTHYNRLVNYMLSDARYIKAYFNLNENDIEELDHMIPVYIGYYGAYFYINKINNFIAGKLTLCELIRL